MGDSLLARQAGKNPPRIPITAAKMNADTILVQFGSNVTVTSDHVIMFIVGNRTRPSASDSTVPTAAPATARRIDSSRNDVKIWNREKPSALSVPISLDRFCTCAYMVI